MSELKETFIEDKFTIDELLKRSWNVTSTKEFTNFFDFIARFSHYSRYNTMLVYIQNPAVTFFGGASYWKKKFGRTVAKDARPYIILAPMGPVMLAYDIFDTEGEETPEEFLINGLGYNPFEVEGYLDERVLLRAIEEAGKWGINIKYKHLSYLQAGFITTVASKTPDIYLKEGQSIEENFAVLIHELAHLFLGHTGHKQLQYEGKEKPISLVSRKRLKRTAEELEAEAVSFLICQKLGLFSKSAEYLAGYINSEDDILQFGYETVIKTADKIEKLFVK